MTTNGQSPFVTLSLGYIGLCEVTKLVKGCFTLSRTAKRLPSL